MADVPSNEELKKAYTLGLASPRCELTFTMLTEKLELSKEKAQNVFKKLAAGRFCSHPKRNARGDFVVIVREAELCTRLKQIQQAETYAVFRAIESAGSAGTSARDISRVVNEELVGKGAITPQTVAKCLKQLEIEKVVKQIKSIHNKTRRLFIVANLEADTSVVGGVFYKDGDFDDDLVDEYRERILHYVSTHGQALKKNVITFLQSGGFKIDLGEHDLERVFRTLVLDQQLVQTIQPKTGDIYFTVARWPAFDDLESIPCISCPHFDSCQIEDIDRFDAVMLRQSIIPSDNFKTDSKSNHMVGLMGGDNSAASGTAPNAFTSKINPSTCPYFSQWLGLTFDPCVPKPLDDSAKDGD